jgi:hypothetical protein
MDNYGGPIIGLGPEGMPGMRNLPRRKGHPLRDLGIEIGILTAIFWARAHKEHPVARAILITWWTILSAFGALIGTAIIEQTLFHSNSDLPCPIAGAATAVIAGIGQWLSLRRYAVSEHLAADANVPAAQAQQYLADFQRGGYAQEAGFNMAEEREKVTVLARVANRLGYTIRWLNEVDGGNAAGQCCHNGVIELDKNVPVESRVSVLAHELTHALQETGAISHLDATLSEIEANAVAFIVCRMLGSRYSSSYEQFYSIPDEVIDNPDVVRAAQEIIGRYNQLRPGPAPSPSRGPAPRPAPRITHITVSGKVHQGAASSCRHRNCRRGRS